MESVGCPYCLCSLSELELPQRAFLDKKSSDALRSHQNVPIKQKRAWYRIFPRGHWSLVITWSFIHDTAYVNSDEIWKHCFRKRKKGGGRLEVYVVIWFVLFSPKRAVNMLSLLSGQSFYICAALSLTLPWHISPSVLQEPGGAAGVDMAASNMMI